MSKNILVITDLDANHIEKLKQIAPDCTFVLTNNGALEEKQVCEADIILGNPPVQMLKGCTHLGMVCLNSAGANTYCVEGVLPKGTILTNATGAYGPMISEWLLGMLMNIYNFFPQYKEQQRKNLWNRLHNKRYSVYGSTVLIVGAGDIGGNFAKRVKALEAYTIGIRRTPREKPDFLDEVYTADALDGLLPKADVVALCLPSTGQTYRIIDQKRLALMKDKAVLLNIGRGTAIDTDALYRHLQTGKLLGVGLDVIDPEPLPADSPLWQMPNLHITPHVSGSTSFAFARDTIAGIFYQNVAAYLNGGKYANLVDLSTGYRKLEE